MIFIQKNKLAIIDSILKYNLLLIPFVLLSGPFIPDFLLTINCLIFLYLSFFKNLKKYFFNAYSYFFYFFFFYLVFNSLISDNILFSLKSSLVYFRFWFLVLCVWYVLDQFDNFRDLLLPVLYLSSSLIILVTVLLLLLPVSLS